MFCNEYVLKIDFYIPSSKKTNTYLLLSTCSMSRSATSALACIHPPVGSGARIIRPLSSSIEVFQTRKKRQNLIFHLRDWCQLIPSSLVLACLHSSRPIIISPLPPLWYQWSLLRCSEVRYILLRVYYRHHLSTDRQRHRNLPILPTLRLRTPVPVSLAVWLWWWSSFRDCGCGGCGGGLLSESSWSARSGSWSIVIHTIAPSP